MRHLTVWDDVVSPQDVLQVSDGFPKSNRRWQLQKVSKVLEPKKHAELVDFLGHKK